MKYYIIAGEASGDLHGSNLMNALKNIDPSADFRFWGGDLMAAQGGILVKHYDQMAFMGFIKVVTNLRAILKNLKMCKTDIVAYQPDVLILIDFAGFNLQIAKFAKQQNLKVFYYISPKIWAWKTSRIKQIKAYVDKMFTILPFETDFYKKYNYPVDYVGNPVNDAINNRAFKDQTETEFKALNSLSDKPLIGLLAGSRKQEIKLMLPVMLQVTRYFPDYQFVIAGAPGINPALYQNIIGRFDVPIVYNQTYQLLQHTKAALVTSGTATLETALMKVPQIVCYHTNVGNLLYNIGRKLLKVKWLSLVNLILGFEAVKELTQATFKTEYLVKELNQLLTNSSYRQQMLDNYQKLNMLIGTPGASKKAANGIYNALTS
jgi:lipid-A-disaccharide synthase